MGKRGPKPKPTALRVLEGNPGKRPILKAEPKPPRAKTITAPKELDAEGKAAWRRVVGQLQTLGVYTELDRDALILYCDAWSQWTKGADHIRKHGVLHESPTGQVRVSPAMLVVDKAFGRMRTMLAAFGMTPSDRVGLTPDAAEEDDAFTAHQKRRFNP
jgi:P27 family predicted phage terminase small subunit